MYDTKSLGNCESVQVARVGKSCPNRHGDKKKHPMSRDGTAVATMKITLVAIVAVIPII